MLKTIEAGRLIFAGLLSFLWSGCVGICAAPALAPARSVDSSMQDVQNAEQSAADFSLAKQQALEPRPGFRQDPADAKRRK